MINQIRPVMSRLLALLAFVLVLFQSAAWAAPNATVSNIRVSQKAAAVRIVFDVSAMPEYKVMTLDNPLRLVIDMPGVVNKAASQYIFDDLTVDKLRLAETEPGKLRAVVDLKTAYMYKVFTLKNPNRLVVDIIKDIDQKLVEDIAPGIQYTSWVRSTGKGPVWAHILDVDIIKDIDQKLVEDIAPGIQYTSWVRSTGKGPVWAHILDVDLAAGYAVTPVLSNGMVKGLEPLLSIAGRSQAIAAVNGSYFALDGSIIGLLKINDELISTPALARTALGIRPDGKLFIDQVQYQGDVELPGGQLLPINAINRARGENELVLYNHLYANVTGSNNHGVEYLVIDDIVTAVNGENSQIPPDGIVLSAHGQKADQLSTLKIGDSVKITHTLGAEWDDARHALGAGPMLVKNKSVFLTTKIEEFGSDVAGGRAPRTALGLKPDGGLLLVVVDGRQQNSIGMTLLELALFMQELGVQDAMNLDGGGSSEMVLKGKIINKPSDGRERRVGNALAIISSRIAN